MRLVDDEPVDRPGRDRSPSLIVGQLLGTEEYESERAGGQIGEHRSPSTLPPQRAHDRRPSDVQAPNAAS